MLFYHYCQGEYLWGRGMFSSGNKGLRVLLALGLVALGGCRILVEVPAGGQVVSDQGLTCSAGSTCIVDVEDTSYEETFEAVAAPGYTFTGWAHVGGQTVCGNTEAPCAFDLTIFSGNALITALLVGDNDVVLAPVFEPVNDSSRYNVSEWQDFLDELGSFSYRSDSFLYAVQPDVGNCDPGVLNTAATSRFLYALNLVRKLHYLPPVEYDAFYNAEMQQANLVQLANDYFTHHPSPGDVCYTAAADTGAGTSNISWSSWQGDPALYALGWINDNHNVSSLMAAGHRRWALFPNLGYTAYGQVGGYSSMKVFGFNSPPGYDLPDDLEYVAFPYRNYPHVLVEKGSNPTPWSISIVPSSGSGNYGYFDSASVSVRHAGTGAALNVHSQYSDNFGYGLRNFYSWMVENWQYDTPYIVTISNVQIPGAGSTTIEYPVEIDLAEF